MIILIEFICSFFSCLFFAIIYNTPKKELLYCGFVGGVGYVIYFILDRFYNLGLLGTFLGSVAICIMSKYYSALHSMPKLLYVLPAIYPLVPGAGIYYAMHDIMINDFVAASNEAYIALKYVGVAVLAMIIILPDQFFTFSSIVKKNSKEEDCEEIEIEENKNSC